MLTVKLKSGTHWDGEEYKRVGDRLEIDRHTYDNHPERFEIIEKSGNDKPLSDEEKRQKRIDELLVEGEELNDDGFPIDFEPSSLDPRFKKLPKDIDFPYKYSDKSSWHFISNGAKVLGYDEAERAEELYQLIYGTDKEE